IPGRRGSVRVGAVQAHAPERPDTLAAASAPISLWVPAGSFVVRDVSLLAEIGLAHLGVVPDLLRSTGDDGATGHQHGDPIRDRKHRLDIVLDEQDGMRALQVLYELDHQPGFVSAHSGKRFVKKEKL